jgi:hypothetical protein
MNSTNHEATQRVISWVFLPLPPWRFKIFSSFCSGISSVHVLPFGGEARLFPFHPQEERATISSLVSFKPFWALVPELPCRWVNRLAGEQTISRSVHDFTTFNFSWLFICTSNLLFNPLRYLVWNIINGWHHGVLDILDKPAASQPLSNFPTLYGIRRFINVFTTVLN